MATSANPPDGGPDLSRCPNAGEYVRRRLDHADGALSPSELADEYGCTNVHMRQVMAGLADEGDIRRVARGRYVAGEPSTDEPPEEDMGSSDDAADESLKEDTESSDDAADENLPEKMATPEEYERQHNGGPDENLGDATDSSDDVADELPEEDTGSSESAADESPEDDTQSAGAAEAGVAAAATGAAAAANSDASLVDRIDWGTVALGVGIVLVLLLLHRHYSQDDQDDAPTDSGGEEVEDVPLVEDGGLAPTGVNDG